MANLLKGKDVANSINELSKTKVEALIQKGIAPTLATFRVGEKSDDISYEKNIIKRCDELGIKVINNVFDESITIAEFISNIIDANNNENIHGILIFRPLPKKFDDEVIRNLIKADKDVDGCSNSSLAGVFTNTNVGYAPCTAEAAMEILNFYNIDVKGKNVVVLGRSLVVGKPLSMLLLNKNATVTICHTKTIDTASIAKKADILICATGQMESINKEYVNDKQVIVDVGISWNNEKNKLCGDVLFEEVEPLVEAITPVPGGVGSVTTSLLLSHVIKAAERKIENE